MNQFPLSRRDLLTSLAAGGATLAVGGCAGTRAAAPPLAASPAVARAAPAASELLEQLARQMLDLMPEAATSLGLDNGEQAGLRRRLGDRSGAGQARIASLLRQAMQNMARIDPAGLDEATRTSMAVVRSAFATALDGFALPYGDVAVGGWRNTPYVVIQNVGAYLDVPRFLDGDHPVRNAADAEAYLARMAAMPTVLEGELERLVDSGEYAIAFALFHTTIDELMALADADKIMPPKSTWFEPKLRSGLFVHLLR